MTWGLERKGAPIDCHAAAVASVEVMTVSAHGVQRTDVFPCPASSAVITGLPSDAYTVRLGLLDEHGAPMLTALDVPGVAVAADATTDLGRMTFSLDQTVVPSRLPEGLAPDAGKK